MLKSVMAPYYYDLIFPLNIRPLTYMSRDELTPGSLVRAQVKKTLRTGLVLGTAGGPPSGKGPVKDISSTLGQGPVLGPPMLELIGWMAAYYMASEGSVLKSVFPREFLKPVKKRAAKAAPGQGVQKRPKPDVTEPLAEVDVEALKGIAADIESGTYGTYLMHAPGLSAELASAVELIGGIGPDGGGAIVLVPELARLKLVQDVLRARFGTRVAVLHSGLTGGERTLELEKIVSGNADIVVGSRYAVFAPLKRVSLIVAMEEESSLYKSEGGVRYSARDMAVKRGSLQHAPVLLSSICPSVESYHNAKKGKYRLIRPRKGGGPAPRVTLLGMRRAKRVTPYLSTALYERALLKIKEGGRVVFFINRRGHSLLGCEECGHVEMCDSCSVPLVFHKSDRTLRCHVCGRENRPAEFCPECGGVKIAPLGAGIERAKEDIARLMSTEPLTLEGGRGGKGGKAKLKLRSYSDEAAGGTGREEVVIGTKLVARRPSLGGFALAGVINGDSYLHHPDYRARERAFQTLNYLAQKAPEVVIQTGSPNSPLLRYFKANDYAGFFREELRDRREMGYPPFTKTAIVAFKELPPGGRGAAAAVINDISAEVQVLGPAQSLTKTGATEWRILLKAPTGEALREALSPIIKWARGGPGGRGGLGGRNSKAGVRVDIDPISI